MNELDPNRMPKHVAIIMDGNRRYSKIPMPFQLKTSTGLNMRLKD